MLTLTYRLVSNSSSLLSKVIIGAITLVSAQGLAFCLTVLFQCKNPSLYWTLSFAPQPQCISETKMLLAAGIVNTVTDAVVVILPIPTVWSVKIPVQQQIVLVLLFAAGFFITLVGAVRTYYMYKVNSTYDKTWLAFPVWLTSSVELYVGIVSLLPFLTIDDPANLVSRYVPRSQRRNDSLVNLVRGGSNLRLHPHMLPLSHGLCKPRITDIHTRKMRMRSG